MLEALCAAIFLVGAGLLGFRALAALWIRRWLQLSRSTRSTGPIAESAALICLLPAYREQALARETLAAFFNAVNEERSARVVVITSLREERERDTPITASRVGDAVRPRENFSASSTARRLDHEGVQPIPSSEPVGRSVAPPATTTEIVRDLVRHLPADKFLHLIYEGEGGGKAVHLNFALKELSTKGQAFGPNTYIGVYDFDSRPEPGSLSAVAAVAIAAPDAIVQPVVPVLRADVATRAAAADAAIHVLRGLGVEGFVWWLWCRVPKLRVLWRMLLDPYFVGSGLFVRADRLTAVGGFPVPVDDVPLGFGAAEKRWRVIPTGHLCLTQCYPNLRAAVRSRTLVFHAYWQFVASIPHRPSRIATGTFREAVMWFISPVILTAAASALVIERHWTTLMLALAVSAVVVCASVAIAHRIGNEVSREFPPLRFGSLLIAPFYAYWRAVSAWRCAAMSIAARTGAVDFTGNKTPRIDREEQE